jgi:plasmid stabilization system protein ParE
MRVAFTAHAIRRLHEIHAYVSEDSPTNADRLIDRIISRAESLAQQSLRGRKVPEYVREDVREIRERPYRIIYLVEARRVRILTVMHERQLLPGDLQGST